MDNINIWVYILVILGVVLSNIMTNKKKTKSADSDQKNDEDENDSATWEEIFGSFEKEEPRIEEVTPPTGKTTSPNSVSDVSFALSNRISLYNTTTDAPLNAKSSAKSNAKSNIETTEHNDILDDPEDLRRAIIAHEILKRRF